MEYRRYSRPDTPVSIRPEVFESTLADRYRALIRWDGPQHPAFNTYSARLKSCEKAWPHHNAEAFSAVGLFYTGTDLVITYAQNGTHSTLHPYITVFQLLTRRDDKTICFHCYDGLQDWLGTDDP